MSSIHLNKMYANDIIDNNPKSSNQPSPSKSICATIRKIFKTIISAFIPNNASKPSSDKKIWRINLFGKQKQPNVKPATTPKNPEHAPTIIRTNSFSRVDPYNHTPMDCYGFKEDDYDNA